MTKEDRFKQYQERQAKRGFVSVRVYVPEKDADKLKVFAAKLRKQVKK